MCQRPVHGHATKVQELSNMFNFHERIMRDLDVIRSHLYGPVTDRVVSLWYALQNIVDLPSLSSIFNSEDDKEAAMACMASSAAMPFLHALLEYMISAIYLRAMLVPTQTPLLPRFLSTELQITAVFAPPVRND